MSGHAAEKKTPLQRVLYAVALAVVFGVLFESTHMVPHFSGGIATLGAALWIFQRRDF